MGRLTQEEINVDLFDEVKRLRKELVESNRKLKELQEVSMQVTKAGHKMIDALKEHVSYFDTGESDYVEETYDPSVENNQKGG